ncbi:mucin-2 [Streptomyces sp. ML-6]|uniref:mucin-2 n=1 Tax=Streptomyces sp. ML-6 TaxID=2982693 RepID=UPI0024C024BD|nr:mucin-2 [Streptomyces sp. ML-6]MDK0520358.1 mucin-2 [Streptomyces sp. ML-6]
MHPKLIKAGNGGLGLWLRAGSYAAQHLTEGAVPGVVAQLYGTAPQARKLVAAGLWHEHGHGCARCPDVPAGDFYMHDFLVYNPSRAKVEQGRAAAADRQQRARDRASEKRAERETRRESPPKKNSFTGETSDENSETAPENIEFPDLFAGQGMQSHRDGTGPSRSPRPDPSRSTSFGSTTPPSPQGERAAAAALVDSWWSTYGRSTAQSRTAIRRAVADALTNGLDEQLLAAALDRLGQTSKPVTGGTLQFALADIRRQPAPGSNVVPIATGRPSTTDQRVAEGMSLAARLRAEEAAQ